MDKPVFLWWAHKELWDTLARNPELCERDAIEKMQEKYPALATQTIGHHCFLCHAARPVSKAMARIDSCYGKCPLKWVGHAKVYPCLYTVDIASMSLVDDGLYRRWSDAQEAGDYSKAAELAAQIRDLPLACYARDMYGVKESPDD